VGGILLGYLADRFGRIPALILCNLIGAVAGIITTFSFNFPVFAFSRFLMGMAFDNCFTLMYILGELQIDIDNV
jgi:MFS family permease